MAPRLPRAAPRRQRHATLVRPRARRRRVLDVRALSIVFLAACGGPPANTPVGVAERFLDLYFVEIDQEKALPLLTDPAREAIEEELREVAKIRAEGYGPAQAKGKAYYQQSYRQEDPSSGSARLVYDLTMELGEGESSRTRRHVLLSLRKEAGQWKVASFTIRDGVSPRAPR